MTTFKDGIETGQYLNTASVDDATLEELERLHFAAKLATYGADIELTDYKEQIQLGPNVPHNMYVSSSWKNQETGQWEARHQDMTPDEDIFVYLFFRKTPQLGNLRRYYFPKRVIDIIRGERPDEELSYPDGDGGRKRIWLSRHGLSQEAGSLLKYIL